VTSFNPQGKEFTVRNLRLSIFAAFVILAIRNRPDAAAVALSGLVMDRRS
jgi:hypothetical protein